MQADSADSFVTRHFKVRSDFSQITGVKEKKIRYECFRRVTKFRKPCSATRYTLL